MDLHPLRELFAPMLGFIAAVVWTLAAVVTTVFGRIKKLQLPAESVPGSSRGLLNLILFAPFLVCFFLIKPALAWPALIASLVFLAGAFVCYQKYAGELSLYRYTKPRPRGFLWWKSVAEDLVIGGPDLEPLAAAKKAQTGATEQQMLAEAEYKPDVIWTRKTRIPVQLRIERWFYAFMLCALLTVILAALAGQALLSGEAPFTTAQRVWAKVFPPGR